LDVVLSGRVFGVVIVACACASTACQLGGAADPELGLDVVVANAAPIMCTHSLPSCPSPPPSWSGEVRGIVAAVCGNCHADGGVEQSAFDFSTYQKVAGNQEAMLLQLSSCAMPPADAGVLLPSADRQTLLAWLVCNAPNN
jgi:hypothetical protein